MNKISFFATLFFYLVSVNFISHGYSLAQNLSPSEPSKKTQLHKQIPFNNFDLIIEQNSNTNISLHIKFHEKSRKVEGFIVENPNRIVLDMEGARSSTARGLNIDSPLVSRLRVGIHPNKTRIVLDTKIKGSIRIENIPGETDLQSSFRVYFDDLTVADPIDTKVDTAVSQTSEQSHIAEIKEVSSTPAVEKSATPSPRPLPSPLTKISNVPGEVASPLALVSTPDDEIERDTSDSIANKISVDQGKVIDLATLETASKVDENENNALDPADKKMASVKPELPTAEPLASAQKIERETGPTDTGRALNPSAEPIAADDPRAIVKNIVFQSSSENFASSIVVIASALGRYELKQKSSNEYELILKSTRLKGEHLSLPQFPPDSFKGFRYLSSSERDNDTIVHIFVDEATRLTAFIAEGKLWVKAN